MFASAHGDANSGPQMDPVSPGKQSGRDLHQSKLRDDKCTQKHFPRVHRMLVTICLQAFEHIGTTPSTNLISAHTYHCMLTDSSCLPTHANGWIRKLCNVWTLMQLSQLKNQSWCTITHTCVGSLPSSSVYSMLADGCGCFTHMWLIIDCLL